VKNYVDKLDHVIVTGNKVVIAAIATGEMPDGSELKVPRCIILTIENGKIAHVDSYGDHSQSGPLDVLLPYEEMFAAIGAN
jgi:ketosteroid isomerase-like protein